MSEQPTNKYTTWGGEMLPLGFEVWEWDQPTLDVKEYWLVFHTPNNDELLGSFRWRLKELISSQFVYIQMTVNSNPLCPKFRAQMIFANHLPELLSGQKPERDPTHAELMAAIQLMHAKIIGLGDVRNLFKPTIINSDGLVGNVEPIPNTSKEEALRLARECKDPTPALPVNGAGAVMSDE